MQAFQDEKYEHWVLVHNMVHVDRMPYIVGRTGSSQLIKLITTPRLKRGLGERRG